MNKKQALDLFEIKRKEFLSNARWVAKRLAYKKGQVTIDDVREQVKIPDFIDGRVMGAVFNRDEWEKVGYINTKVKSSHGRPVAVFKLLGEEPSQMGMW